MGNVEKIPAIIYRDPPELILLERKQVDKDELLKHYEEKDYTGYWQQFPFPGLLYCRQPLTTIKEIYSVFEKIKKIDKDVFHQFHKGNPYYWLGVAYFQLGDYASAVYFMNAAAKEDLELRNPNKPSSATWFIGLNSWSKNQAGRVIVQQAALEMRKLIRNYNTCLQREEHNNPFSMKLLREKILRKAIEIKNPCYQSISTALISFVLEFNNRIERLRILDSLESIEPFAHHLFKGCVLLESLLKENPGRNNNLKSSDDLIKWVREKSKSLDIPEKLTLDNKSLQSIINDIPKGSIKLIDSFSLACRIRNTTGHSIEWQLKITEKQYSKLYKAIGFSCLHVINKLY